MRHRLETAISLFLALTVAGVGCGICGLGTLAIRGDLSWSIGGAQYRLWLIREREGSGLALSQTTAYRNPEGRLCQRTDVWFWLWAPRLSLQPVTYEECPPSGQHHEPRSSLNPSSAQARENGADGPTDRGRAGNYLTPRALVGTSGRGVA
ncbi:hypothetical protein [Thermoflexus sp.]|uniref:hypothetical protein n=1 Tax=Thermoflexus sp. TaxID=1969742 RepID=UPI0035E43572